MFGAAQEKDVDTMRILDRSHRRQPTRRGKRNHVQHVRNKPPMLGVSWRPAATEESEKLSTPKLCRIKDKHPQRTSEPEPSQLDSIMAALGAWGTAPTRTAWATEV